MKASKATGFLLGFFAAGMSTMFMVGVVVAIGIAKGAPCVRSCS